MTPPDSSDTWVRLRPLPSDVPADVRLRTALKVLLRRYRLRAMEIRGTSPTVRIPDLTERFPEG
jgi:hypothetical protein